MDVDDEEAGKREKTMKKRDKGKKKATRPLSPSSELAHSELYSEEAHLSGLVSSLEREGIGLEVARDAVTSDSAVMAFEALLAVIDDLRRESDRANRARKLAENQLVSARKRPASPSSPPKEELPRKVRGLGSSAQSFSASRNSDREGPTVGPSKQPSERGHPPAALPSAGHSLAQPSRAPSTTHRKFPTGQTEPVAGPSSTRQQMGAPPHYSQASEERRVTTNPPRSSRPQGVNENPPSYESASSSRGSRGRERGSGRGRGGRTLPEVPPTPAMPGNPRLLPAVETPWPVIPRTASRILRDSTPAPTPSPLNSDSDDGRSSGEEDEPPLKDQLSFTDDETNLGESERDRKTRRANNARLQEKIRQRDEAAARIKNSRPGFISDYIGIFKDTKRGAAKERDNSFRGMLSNMFYWSPLTNTVFTGELAHDAAALERRVRRPFFPPTGSQLYKRIPRGLPMNPQEVDDLVTFINNSRKPVWERAMGYKLMAQLLTIANRIAPSERDRSMVHLLKVEVMGRVIQPASNEDDVWKDEPVPPPEGILSVPPNYSTAGSRVGTPEDPFDFKQVIRHLSIHCRPGGRNPLHGIIFDYAFRLNLRSVFGYALGRALAPPGKHGRRAFMNAFITILARPRLYDESIVAWNNANPDRLFVPVTTGASLKIQRMDLHEAHWRNVSEEDVIAAMIANGIPPAWVAHGYPYGAQHIRGQTQAGSMNAPHLVDIDADRVRRIREGGIPQAIPEWDGWSDPSTHDIHCIWALITQENRSIPPIDCFDNDSWFQLGEDPMEAPGLGERPVSSMAGGSGAIYAPHQSTTEGQVETAGNPLSVSIEALSLERETTGGLDTAMEEGVVDVRIDESEGPMDPSGILEG